MNEGLDSDQLNKLILFRNIFQASVSSPVPYHDFHKLEPSLTRPLANPTAALKRSPQLLNTAVLSTAEASRDESTLPEVLVPPSPPQSAAD